MNMVNYLFWFFVFIVPFIIFIARPENNKWLYIGRLLIAVAVGHGLLAYTAITHQEYRLQKYSDCRVNNISEPHNKCLVPIDDTFVWFYAALGWLPVMGYTAIIEIIWRVYHRKTVKQMGKEFKGKFASNIFILLSLPGILVAAIVIITNYKYF